MNVIAPILTRKNDLLRQSIFYPFKLFSYHAKGSALDALCKTPHYETDQFGSVPLLDVSASFNEEDEGSAVFIVNRSQRSTETTGIRWLDWNPGPSIEVFQLHGSDPKMFNTFENPGAVTAKSMGNLEVKDQYLELSLPPLSFTCLVSSPKV